LEPQLLLEIKLAMVSVAVAVVVAEKVEEAVHHSL
jgi:hypothetical protein